MIRRSRHGSCVEGDNGFANILWSKNEEVEAAEAVSLGAQAVKMLLHAAKNA